MAYDSKPAWSPVFLRDGTVARQRGGRGEHQVGRTTSTGYSVRGMTERFLDSLDDGSARDRYARPFTPEAARELHWYLAGYVTEELGARRLSDVSREDVEELIYRLGDGGVPRRRLCALAKSVRALYDYAAELDIVRHNPAERVAIPDEDETQQPTPRDVSAVEPGPERALLDRSISLALRVTTLCVLLIALFMLASSM